MTETKKRIFSMKTKNNTTLCVIFLHVKSFYRNKFFLLDLYIAISSGLCTIVFQINSYQNLKLSFIIRNVD